MGIKSTDLKIERFNSGRGGMNQNAHPKNVRMTHIPTGIQVVMCGRYYHKNVAMAKKEMENRIQEEKDNDAAAKKKAHRDQKIKEHRVVRTYDFTTGIARDHRTGAKLQLRKVMKGDIDFLDL